jgi:antitoxin ParD1/3/4
MQVSLPPDLERFVTELIGSGQYHSPEEAVRAGLCLLQDQERLRRIRLEEVRKEIAIGIEQADRGELIDGEEVFASLRDKMPKNAGPPS